MASLGDLFGGSSTAEQFLVWGILQQLFGAALGPTTSDIQQAVFSADPVIPLTPEQLATATVRQILDTGNAANEATKSGIGAGRFQTLVELAQQPPSLSLILAMYQRSMGQGGPGSALGVDIDTALADLGISEQYRALVKDLAVEIPDPSQILLAWLTGQIAEDEARGRLLATGMDPTWIDSAYNAEGQAPTPNELLDLWNRGVIPEDGTGAGVVSYEQGFLEGPWRNKWLPAFKALRKYYPPPRTIQAMRREGTITEDEARDWLSKYGVIDDVLDAFLAGTSHAATPTVRELSRADITGLYADQLINADQAITDLKALNYGDADARLIIALADSKAAAAATKSAVTRLQHLYLAKTNTAATTRTALSGLGIADQQISNLIATWDLEQAATVRTLTEAQIVSAWNYSIFDADPATNKSIALDRLTALGYSTADATIILEIRNKGVFT